MKKLTNIFIAFIAIVSLNACSEDDDFTFTAKPDPEGISFTNSTSEVYILKASNGDNLAERFVWNEVNFDVPTPVNYELLGSPTESFESSSVLGDVTVTNISVTVASMLELAKEAGLDNDPETDMPNSGNLFFKVRAYVGSDAGNVVDKTSEILQLTVMLPEAVETGTEELPTLYVVGNFLNASGYGPDWTTPNAVPLAASATGKTDFEGFVNMDVDAPQFKFLPTNEDFTGDYGDAGESDGSYTGVLKQEGEVNAGTPEGTGGYFYIKADTEALTYSLTKTSWGVIGNATPTGWDSDTDMIYDPETKTWSLTLDLIKQEPTDNGLKFRANDAWDLNIGDTDADGTLEFGGDNIGVPEDGNYTIILDLSNPRKYTYSLTKN